MNHRTEPAQKDYCVAYATPLKPRVRIVDGEYVAVERRRQRNGKR